MDFVSGFDANPPPGRSYEYRFVHRCSGSPGMSYVFDRVLSAIPLTWVRASERIWPWSGYRLGNLDPQLVRSESHRVSKHD